MVFFCPARMQCEFYDPDLPEETQKHLFQVWLNQDKLRDAQGKSDGTK